MFEFYHQFLAGSHIFQSTNSGSQIYTFEMSLINNCHLFWAEIRAAFLRLKRTKPLGLDVEWRPATPYRFVFEKLSLQW